MIPFSADTAKALWEYAVAERADAPANEAFFVGAQGPLTRSGLLQLVRSLGERAGVPDVHPHRFRHTFAVNFLINGGDPYALQDLLGHESMEMVRRYVHLAATNLVTAHQKASPVANWRLNRK
jgi:site-specific recombinase XerD